MDLFQNLVILGGVRIGVLGGIGPEASAEFYSKLIKAIQDSGLIKENKDYPQIIINSIPAQELVAKHIREEDLDAYVSGIRELSSLSPDFIVMVCNTIHLYYDFLSSFSRVPIIDLRKEVKNKIIEGGYKKIFILGTKNTISQGLYKIESLETLVPNQCEQDILEEAILKYNCGLEKEEQRRIIERICEKYLAQGAEVFILGCTEFALILSDSKLNKINTIDVLVEVVLKSFINNRELSKL